MFWWAGCVCVCVCVCVKQWFWKLLALGSYYTSKNYWEFQGTFVYVYWCLLYGSSVEFSRSVMSDSLQPHGLQHTRFHCPSELPEFTQTHVHQVGDAIQPSHPLSSPSPPAFSLCQHQGLFQWVSSSHQVPKVLKFQLQHQSFQWIFRTEFPSDGVVGYPCSPRDSQKSSPTLQFKTINSLVCSFLYSPTLTFIHDYWKNHSLDDTDWCWQSNVLAL